MPEDGRPHSSVVCLVVLEVSKRFFEGVYSGLFGGSYNVFFPLHGFFGVFFRGFWRCLNDFWRCL